MHDRYQARWTSKALSDSLRKAGKLGSCVLVDSFNGYILIEPAGSRLGDGALLSLEEADYELRPVWCPGARSRLIEARRLLGLPIDAGSRVLTPALV